MTHQQSQRRLEQTLRHLHPSLPPSPLLPTPTTTTTTTTTKKPVRVLVTGAAGQIAYSILFSIGSGYMLGDDQPIILHLLEIPGMEEKLKGVVMELQDCYFPLVKGVVATVDPAVGFDMVDVAILVGAFPRKKGMERAELLSKNAGIFSAQGKALAQYASRDVKICVVGNPANTNCLLALHSASGLPHKNFTAMTRLDQNRAMGLIREKLNLKGDQDVKNVIIWGNHSANQYPDLSHAVITNYPEPGLSTSLLAAVNDDEWVKTTYIPAVQKRGAKIIEARKLSSAASAANAAVDHVRSWLCGTGPGEVVSMGVLSDGRDYGVPAGVVFSFPVVCSGGEWKIVQGLQISDYSRSMMKKSEDELVAEKEEAMKLLGKK